MRQVPLLSLFLATALTTVPPAFAQQNDTPLWRGQPVPDVMPRHRIVIRQGLPDSFDDVAALPLPPEAVAEGRELYLRHCAACHGQDGQGTTPGVVGTDQYPGNLDRLVNTAFGKSDSYMYWTITRGGEPVGSNMPAFRGVLSDQEIWATVAYLRSTFGDG